MSKNSKPTPQPAKPAARAAGSRPRPSRRAPAEVWTEVANFVVTFESRNARAGAQEKRITAHKMQEGGITATWTGAELRPMCQWIGEHVGDWTDEVPAQPAAAPAAETTPRAIAATAAAAASGRAPGEPPRVSLTISQLRALKAARELTAEHPAASGQEPASTPLSAGSAFDLEAVLEIDAGGALAPSSIPTHCPVEFFSRNLLTAEKQRLGDASTGVLVQGRTSYSATLPRVRFPAGTYQLACVAKLPNATLPFAYLQGPVLQVA